MAYLVGTDEAGYGPNLGPLVVTATVWQVPDSWLQQPLARSMAAELDPLFSGPASAGTPCRVHLADSKQLYAPGSGLERLERGVLTMLGTVAEIPRRWRDIWSVLHASSPAEIDAEPWFGGYDVPLPRCVAYDEVQALAQHIEAELQTRQVKVLQMHARAIFAAQFNQHLDDYGNKASALSFLTLDLVRRILQTLAPAPVIVSCDKHGGRNHYHPLLQTLFPDDWIEIIDEGREASIYRWGRAPQRIEFRFVARGESFLPSALASMTSKYLRELAMEAFNRYWCERVANLRPTAGYPVDAARFRAEIRAAQCHLGISDRQLWRNR